MKALTTVYLENNAEYEVTGTSGKYKLDFNFSNNPAAFESQKATSLSKNQDLNNMIYSIEDDANQYHFRFTIGDGGWHFVLDKNPNNDAWYTLHCSTRELHLSINLVKDLKLFCQQIARIKQMQTDYVNKK